MPVNPPPPTSSKGRRIRNSSVVTAAVDGTHSSRKSGDVRSFDCELARGSAKLSTKKLLCPTGGTAADTQAIGWQWAGNGLGGIWDRGRASTSTTTSSQASAIVADRNKVTAKMLQSRDLLQSESRQFKHYGPCLTFRGCSMTLDPTTKYQLTLFFLTGTDQVLQQAVWKL